jgi:hypothetical protein
MPVRRFDKISQIADVVHLGCAPHGLGRIPVVLVPCHEPLLRAFGARNATMSITQLCWQLPTGPS